jgi:chromosome segregation ATPase
VLQKQYEQKKEEADEQLKKVLRAQEELNQLNRTLKQVEEYNEVMKGEIATTRRAAYNVEEGVVNLEREKKKQDLLIDSMNEEIKRLNDNKTLYQAQLISQKEETAAARNTLKEASLEIDKVIMSKNTLLSDWKNSIKDMKYKDTAFQSLKDLVKEKKKEIVRIDVEIVGAKKEIKAEQNISERLHDRQAKYGMERNFLEEKRNQINDEIKRLEEQEKMLKKSQNSTKDELQRLDIERSDVQHQMSTLEKSIITLHSKTKKLRDDIVDYASKQKTIEKSSANLNKQTESMYGDINKKEVEIEDIANEISRVKIDVLNTKTQNELLENKFKSLKEELDAKEKEVKKNEDMINKNLADIQKKQLEVDKLNKQLGELSKSDKQDSAVPLVAKRNKIEKEINEREEQIDNIKKEWISNQTKFVNNQHTLQENQGINDQYKTKRIILEQKKMRLNQNFDSQNKQIRQLEIALKNLDFDMNKLNDTFSDNLDKQKNLKNENFNLENEFVQKLKELENDSIKLENNIQNLKEEKADILAEIVEAERQILLWERKIQLEKEMQDTLDPNIGQSEIVAMKQEIHRMELRYEQLKKKQEQMIKDMERAVFKRETIQLKYLPKVEKKNAQDKTSQGKLSRQIANLKQTLKHTTESSINLDSTIEQKIQELERVNEEIEKANGEIQGVEEDSNNRHLDLISLKMERQQNLYNIYKLQTEGKRFDEIANGRFRPSVEEEKVEEAIQEQKARNHHVAEILANVMNENQELEPVLARLVDWASDAQ